MTTRLHRACLGLKSMKPTKQQKTSLQRLRLPRRGDLLFNFVEMLTSLCSSSSAGPTASPDPTSCATTRTAQAADARIEAVLADTAAFHRPSPSTPSQKLSLGEGHRIRTLLRNSPGADASQEDREVAAGEAEATTSATVIFAFWLRHVAEVAKAMAALLEQPFSKQKKAVLALLLCFFSRPHRLSRYSSPFGCSGIRTRVLGM